MPGKWITVPITAAVSAWSGSVSGAQEAGRSSPALPADPLTAGTLTQLVLGMILVLGLIALSAWLLRRFNRFQSAAGGQLKVVGGLSMGARERLVVVQVGEQQLLLGVAPGRVQTLHVLDEPLRDANAGGTRGDGGFAQRLQSALRQGAGK